MCVLHTHIVCVMIELAVELYYSTNRIFYNYRIDSRIQFYINDLTHTPDCTLFDTTFFYRTFFNRTFSNRTFFNRTFLDRTSLNRTFFLAFWWNYFLFQNLAIWLLGSWPMAERRARFAPKLVHWMLFYFRVWFASNVLNEKSLNNSL